jgi:PAB-dependent poly(A)-specific ribonuclease subunit 3
MHLNRNPPYERVPPVIWSELIDESTIWSYMIQISNAMKAVHDRGLALRIVDPTKVLLTGKGRSVH